MKKKLVIAMLALPLVLLIMCKNETMQNKPTQIIVKDYNDKIVAEIGVQDDQLQGLCIWYNSAGNPMACGLFSEGRPYTGTFINWTKIFNNWGTDPYNVERYAQDHISMFESAGFGVQRDYKAVIESYYNGELIINN